MNSIDLKFTIDALKRVLFENAFSDKILQNSGNDTMNHGFVRFALFGTLRHYFFIDVYLMDGLLSRSKIKKYDKFLVAAMYLSIFLLKNSKTENHTVVNEIVKLIKKEINEAASKVANGVLRNALRKGLYHENVEALCSTSEFYGKIKRDNPKSYQSIIANLLKSDVKAGGYFLGEKNKEYETSPYSELYCYVKPEDISSMPDTFIFQDLANHLLMKDFMPFVGNDTKNLEVSAYPGGKSFYLQKGHNIHGDILPWKVTALEKRISQIDNADRSYVALDGTALPFKDESLDNVFVDVPCSGSGIIAKKPEIAVNFSELSMKDTVAVQRGILDEAARVVKVGGNIFYSTCSLFKGENEDQIKKFLKKHKNIILNDEYAPPISRNGYYSSIDHLNEMDGIFGTLLTKKG